ncbi:TetR/AcrR family transcriptional regulator [Kosakonia sp. BYX6]|uniref:TetR/AcrR family transcriptional regulator n=1 Tax=Kosakonia calanthes TaxID=3139408 RepID=A0ABZ3B207_9ENTR
MSRGRPREFDRTDALDNAMKVFWQKGYTATSMNDLYEAMGIKSPSLYAAFGGKEDLYNEVLQHYLQNIAPQIWGCVSTEPSPKKAIAQWLERSAEVLTRCDSPRGCMLVLSAVGSEGNDRLGQQVQQMRSKGIALLKTRLMQACEIGELPVDTDIDALARLYAGIQQGMSIQARDGASRETLLGIARMAMGLWPTL